MMGIMGFILPDPWDTYGKITYLVTYGKMHQKQFAQTIYFEKEKER